MEKLPRAVHDVSCWVCWLHVRTAPRQESFFQEAEKTVGV